MARDDEGAGPLSAVDGILAKGPRAKQVAPKRLAIPRPRAKAPKVEPAAPSSLRKPISLGERSDPGGGHDDEGPIAKGGMAVIHRVFERQLRRPEAMKILAEGIDPGGPQGDAFIEEAQITGQLDHPNIVPIYGLQLGHDDGRPRFTMKLVRGKTLRELVEGLGRQRNDGENVERLVRIVLTVCHALAFAHEKGVVHCDVKPDNVMLGRHGQVYLMDWGAAHLVKQEDESREGRRGAGTPDCMAPEQVGAFDGKLDARTDVFGVGGLLYFALTGRAPRKAQANAYEAMMAAHEAKTRPPTEVTPGVALPPGLCAITMRCLAREPSERFPSARAVGEALEDFLRGGGWLETRRYEDGKAIVREGDVGNAAYVVVEGTCVVTRRDRDGRGTIDLGTIEAGSVFGETAILTSKPRAATVRAQGPVTVKVITAESLSRELGRHQWLQSLVTALAERFRELSGPD